tara:strand:+ start:617 stop:1084 length:468 start_codon:yes stop_codon:yes gene_type:complete
MSENLPLRTGVGAIVLNDENKVFVGKRKDNPSNQWQMPQGGVDLGESFFQALKRELIEETNIKNFKLIKELDNWYTYELPKNLVGIIWKGKYRGQKQKWFILKFTGSDAEINIKTSKPEFIEWKWVSIETLPAIIVDFKRNLYTQLVGEIQKYIK